MAEIAVSFLLQQLFVILIEEHHLLGGLKEEVENIRFELNQLNEFLRIVFEKDGNNSSRKEWIKQLTEIAYDIEDVLDKHMPRRAENMFMKFYNNHKVASQIPIIKKRLLNVSTSQQKYRDIYDSKDQGSSSTFRENERNDGRGNALFLDDDDVVGIEEPMEQLFEWIRSRHDILEVISVVGMGGQGKTTLVKKVYDHPSIKTHFNHHVWIVASEYKDVKHMLANLIEKLVAEIKKPPPRNLRGMNVDGMRDFIFEFLKEKKYIMCLDDVSQTSTWEAIEPALRRMGSNGCVIIATRLDAIANAACCKTNHIFKLKKLPEKDSCNLFYKKAFPRNPCPLYIKEQFADNILKRCEGLPLAIAVISGLLATKNYKAEEWEKFERSLGHELGGGGSLEELGNSIFSFSYNGLPHHLKYCYLYLSIFPEDGLVEKETIIRLWIAEGLVQQKHNNTKEEVAVDYLDDLFGRNLIEVAQKHIDGRPKAFRIHNLLHTRIISKSREHNIVTISEGGEMQWPNRIRRLVIQKTLCFDREALNLDNLRSLLSLCSERVELGLIKELVGRCRLLKVLDLRGSPLETIPPEVFKLYRLKYLSVRNTMVKSVPKSIKYLENLETLDLKNCNVTELPIEILELHRLRNLLVYRYIGIAVLMDSIQSFTAPCDIGNMKSLLKLCCIDATESDGKKIVTEIRKLTQLRRLGIAKLRRVDGKDLCSSIALLTNLRSLRIDSFEGEKLDLDHSIKLQFLRSLTLKGCIEKVPEWIRSLNELTTLDLYFSRLKDDPLKSLQNLPNLVRLHIHDADVEGLTFKAQGFEKLKELWLRELKCMEWVIVEKGSMISLQEWTMMDCKLLKELPQGMEHFSNLPVLNFVNMADAFVKRVDKAKENGDINWRTAHVSTSASVI